MKKLIYFIPVLIIVVGIFALWRSPYNLDIFNKNNSIDLSKYRMQHLYKQGSGALMVMGLNTVEGSKAHIFEGYASLDMTHRSRKDTFSWTTLRCHIRGTNALMAILSNDREDGIWVTKGEVCCYTSCGIYILRKNDYLRVRQLIGNQLPVPLNVFKDDSIRKQCSDLLVQIYAGIDTTKSSTPGPR